jgi:hypothetical protein
VDVAIIVGRINFRGEPGRDDDYRTRHRPSRGEMAVAAIVVFLTMIIMVAVAWIKYWDMTKYLFRPGTDRILFEDNGAVVPSEISEPVTVIIRNPAITWILIIISISAVLAANLLVRDYFIL